MVFHQHLLLFAGSAARQVTSARDTPLVQLVGPLLAGNARTFMLAAVSPHPDHYLETVNTLRIATRAQNIQVVLLETSLTQARACSCQSCSLQGVNLSQWLLQILDHQLCWVLAGVWND